MKLLILVLMLVLVSCTSKVTKDEKVTKFMSHEEIVQAFNQDFKVMDEGLDAAAKDRESQLVPIDELIPLHIKKDSDKKNAMKMMEARSLADRKGADLSDNDTPIKKQWNGTCTAFATTAGMENKLKGKYDISERSVWSKYKRYSSDAALAAVFKNKVCNESCWLQTNSNPYPCCKGNEKFRLAKYTYHSGLLEPVLDALDRGNPVELAMTTPKDMLSCYKVIRPTTGLSFGGHAILIVGYNIDESVKGGGYFKIKNSWGSHCGDNGYQYLPFHLWDRKDLYTITWELNEVELNGEPIEPNCEYKTVCKRQWYCLWFCKKCYKVRVCK